MMNAPTNTTKTQAAEAAQAWLAQYGGELPQFNPAFASQIAKLDWEASDVHELEQVIGGDPGSVLRLLRVANSPFFGLSKRVDSIRHAFTVLGLSSVCSIVMRGYLIDTFGMADDDKLAGDFVTHCILAGLAARELAPGMGAPKDVAFVAGMLHDVGKLMLLTYARELVEQIYKGGANAADELVDETRLLGFDHTDLGVLTLQCWNLPDPIVDAVHDHHQLALCDTPLKRTIFAANQLARYIEYLRHERLEEAEQVRNRLAELAIDDALLERVNERVGIEAAMMFALG